MWVSNVRRTAMHNLHAVLPEGPYGQGAIAPARPHYVQPVYELQKQTSRIMICYQEMRCHSRGCTFIQMLMLHPFYYLFVYLSTKKIYQETARFLWIPVNKKRSLNNVCNNVKSVKKEDVEMLRCFVDYC